METWNIRFQVVASAEAILHKNELASDSQLFFC